MSSLAPIRRLQKSLFAALRDPWSPKEPLSEAYDALLELAEAVLPAPEWAKVRQLAQEHRDILKATVVR